MGKKSTTSRRIPATNEGELRGTSGNPQLARCPTSLESYIATSACPPRMSVRSVRLRARPASGLTADVCASEALPRSIIGLWSQTTLGELASGSSQLDRPPIPTIMGAKLGDAPAIGRPEGAGQNKGRL